MASSIQSIADGLPVQRYDVQFSLDRLAIGVDNVHFDVRLSQQLIQSVERAALYIVTRHTGTQQMLKTDRAVEWTKAKERFKEDCTAVLTAAVHTAKSRKEIQIDFLAQVAVSKLIFDELRTQFDRVIKHIEHVIRSVELTPHHETRDTSESMKLKEQLKQIRTGRGRLLQQAGDELLEIFVNCQRKGIMELREANFGRENTLPEHIFTNRLIHAESLTDDETLMEHYILLNNRIEDPDSVERVTMLLENFFEEIGLHPSTDLLPEPDEPTARGSLYKPPNPWLMNEENVNVLFNPEGTQRQYRRRRSEKAPKEELKELKQQIRAQKKIYKLFFKKFKKEKLPRLINTAFEMASVYREYCPPLTPRQVHTYITQPTSRKQITARLERIKNFYGKSFSMTPLHKVARRAKRISAKQQKVYVYEFLTAFFRYYRDMTMASHLKTYMNSVHLAVDEKIIALSKENRTLYDFLLKAEQEKKEHPVIGHTIVKADVRGSTDLTYHLKEQGLNPASYFSLNFFDPITQVLFEYDAAKEFIEGDALILSIFEQEETPEGWYSVARACGLAIRMLSIVRDYNKVLEKHTRRFNLYVFQSHTDDENGMTTDDLYLRFNVNGIELHPNGFQKLGNEIELKPFTVGLKGPLENKSRFYAGKIPLVSGKYQPLVIREAPVLTLSPETGKVSGETSRSFFEICTHPKLYERLDKILYHHDKRHGFGFSDLRKMTGHTSLP
ncbi:hypothetical protein D3OALGA1CA_4824 [Olavius algarvensis associated proteobacterium Delta 3]|nr:hypothetical protein D3OALGA1CA_4824 [Olavius algarvensis associated proteobacterium Delta 3]